MTPGGRYTFGGFEVDAVARRVTRDGQPLVLPSRHLDVLLHLVANAGQVVSKESLIEAAWRGVAVTDNSLEQAISTLRRTLGELEHPSYIVTVPRQGYRFGVPVIRLPARASDASLDQLLAPHRAWMEGRAALESLERDQITHARTVFEQVLDQAPDQAAAHVGLANACIMQFEMTRAGSAPDVEARTTAERHARDACGLDPDSGEAWATLGFVLDRTGQSRDGLAALRHATTLEPDNWRHHFRRAYVGWGEERLRAARRTLALLPGFPLAHLMVATVHVARQAFEDAERELAIGIGSDTSQGRFSSVALHWLMGVLAFARGDARAAIAACERELAAEHAGQLYAREFAANSWYTIGAIHWHEGRTPEAVPAFVEAIQRVPVHPMARVGLLLCGEAQLSGISQASDPIAQAAGRLAPVELAAAQAAWMQHAGLRDAAPALVDEALAAAAPGSIGWWLPVDPLLRVTTEGGAWAQALARLRARAA